jgi:hypothetical protein
MDPDKLGFFSVFAEKHKSIRMCRKLAQKYRDQPTTQEFTFPLVSLTVLDLQILLTYNHRGLILLFLHKRIACGQVKFHCTPWKFRALWRNWRKHSLILWRLKADCDIGPTLKSKVRSPPEFSHHFDGILSFVQRFLGSKQNQRKHSRLYSYPQVSIGWPMISSVASLSSMIMITGPYPYLSVRLYTQ